MLVGIGYPNTPHLSCPLPQITNEIVRQLLEQGGIYGLEKPIGDMKFVVDTRCVPPLLSLQGRAAAVKLKRCCVALG